MHFRLAPLFSAAACLSMATPAFAAPLQPNDNWDVDYGETQCIAARSFGSSADPIVLGIAPSLSGNTYQLLVSIQRQGPLYARGSIGAVDFGSGPIRSTALYHGGKGVRLSNYRFRVPAAVMERARSASAIKLSLATGEHYDFAVSDMPMVLESLRSCTADLQQYWHLGGVQLGVPAKSSAADLRSIFRADDYPGEALANMQSGNVQYQLLVNDKGTIAACDVLVSSGAPILDVKGCDVLKERASFNPALDAEGRPIRSVVESPPISWRVGESAFNSSCTWDLGREGIVLNMCNRREQLPHPMMRPVPPPHGTPQPGGSIASAGVRSIR